MSQEQYYYSPDNGASWVGPFDAQQLNELRAAGVIQPSFPTKSAGGGTMQAGQMYQSPLPSSRGYPQSQCYPQAPNYQQPQGIPPVQGYAQQPNPGYMPSPPSEQSLIKGLFIVRFAGRMRRKDYWLSQLLIYAVAFIGCVILGPLGVLLLDSSDHTAVSVVMSILLFVFACILVWLGWAAIVGFGMGVRRLHDIGQSGWMILLNLIPFIGSIILLVMFCMDSQRGANQWGPNPKGY